MTRKKDPFVSSFLVPQGILSSLRSSFLKAPFVPQGKASSRARKEAEERTFRLFVPQGRGGRKILFVTSFLVPQGKEAEGRTFRLFVPQGISRGKDAEERTFRSSRHSKQRQKTLNADRAASEDLDQVVEYFQKLQKIIEIGIVPEDIWNMDETGFRIGVGKDQLMVTKRKRSHYFSIPENRVSATLIEAISAGGCHTPAFILLAGQNHMVHSYHQQELELEMTICPTPTGYTNHHH
ncbi:hypothetical protein HIM_12364 [Hirsutella minnesotensis 3608]|uniref:DDE-1 domain-containing protein n=1 Tax=Hirsutella minnesotensis 3608 TaxID=1043627 RepID=A0A0F7ZI44_9HYPO|nr:hypothetical protein HIM_12364 [Hirsutella minnesotensis 3608]